jgi:hypothetical protein
MPDRGHHTSTYASGRKKIITGVRLLVIGMIAVIVFIFIFIKGIGLTPSIDAFPYLLVGWAGSLVSAIVLLTGIILFFVGRSQEKKQRALDAHDSQSKSK